MSTRVSQLSVPLSHLISGRRNPRRVKPAREAQHCLVALIRSQGLLQPLVVRPAEDKPRHYVVIAGKRRLAALNEIHRQDGGEGDPKIPCILRDVDADTADALALGENFGRAAMHPLDEAEAFSKLPTREGKDAAAVAAEFGVTEQYVKQRSKLASLAGVVKEAYRNHEIDTATAEAFASVPDEKQVEVWTELNGHPRHADHVRNIIAHGWIDASHALFDVSALPEWTVSRDLFSEKVLVERKAFMAAQLEALAAERTSLLEDGWKDVVAGRWEEVRDQSAAMMTPEQEFDAATTEKLEKIAERYRKWEAKLNDAPEDDPAAQASIQEKLQALDEEEWQVIRQAPVFFYEATKAVATVFLMLSPDGQVRREFKVPLTRSKAGTVNWNGHTGEGCDDQTENRPKPPTSDDLKDGQLSATFTHEAIAVREALLKNDAARRRVLALILHDKVRSEALSVSHDANGTTLHASNSEGFASAAFDRLKDKRVKLDPFAGEYALDDRDAYDRLAELTPAKLDALIDLLVVDCITAHMQRETKLVRHLSDELNTNIRHDWRPDAAWLAGYQKIQLSHLMAELRGPVYDPVRETRKKSELVEALATLFRDAAEGKLEDKALAAKVNGWIPANFRGSGSVAA